MIPIYVVVLYTVGAFLTAAASRKSLVDFWDCMMLFAWPLMLVARGAIFLIEGNLWMHLDD